MKSTAATLVLLAFFAGTDAFAQNGTSKSPSGGAGTAYPEAPIGHRQPRPSEVPSEKNLSDPNSAQNREDAALDKKIKSICRGC